MAAKFVIEKDSSGKYRSAAAMEGGIESVKKNAPGAVVEDASGS